MTGQERPFVLPSQNAPYGGIRRRDIYANTTCLFPIDLTVSQPSRVHASLSFTLLFRNDSYRSL